MKTLRTSLLTLAALALLALPAAAQIDPGNDIWATGTGTHITLGDSDWRVLCGKSGPSQYIALKGGDLKGLVAGDTIVRRLDKADFGSRNTATVRIQTRALSFVSEKTETTPCGPLSFRVGLDPDAQQRVGTMTIVRQSNQGGVFHADVLVDGIITAVDASGDDFGSLPFTANLKDPSRGTPWSVRPPIGSSVSKAGFYPGVNPSDLRPVPIDRWHEELEARHAYALAVQDLNPVSSQISNGF